MSNDAEKERFYIRKEMLFTAIRGRQETLITFSAIAAGLLVVATFNQELIPMSNTVRYLILCLLAIIPFTLLGYLLELKQAEDTAIQYFKDFGGDTSQNLYSKLLAYWPWIGFLILFVAVLWMALLVAKPLLPDIYAHATSVATPLGTSPTSSNVSISVWEKLTAIGTLLAVLVALFGKPFLDWWKRPILAIKFKNNAPYCRHTSGIAAIGGGNTQELNSYHLRLQVFNRGKSIAENCKVKLVAIADAEVETLRDDVDPMVLHWVGSDAIAYQLGQEHSVDFSKRPTIGIARQEYEYVDLLSTNEHISHLEFQAIDRDIPRGIAFNIPKEEMLLFVTVYADNANPTSEVIRVTIGESWDNIRLSVEDKATQRRFRGLLDRN